MQVIIYSECGQMYLFKINLKLFCLPLSSNRDRPSSLQSNHEMLFDM